MSLSLACWLVKACLYRVDRGSRFVGEALQKSVPFSIPSVSQTSLFKQVSCCNTCPTQQSTTLVLCVNLSMVQHTLVLRGEPDEAL